MRRSRLVFGVVFVAFSAVLFLTHLHNPSTLQNVYDGKWNVPAFSKPSWGTSKSGEKDNALSFGNVDYESSLGKEYPYLPDGIEDGQEDSGLISHKTGGNWDECSELGCEYRYDEIEEIGKLPSKIPTPPVEDEEQQFSVATTMPAAPLATDGAFDNTKYLFQQDLDLPLPARNLSMFKDYWPHNYHPGGPHTYTYAAFVNTRNPSVKDPYFMALQNLIWRVLWSPRSKSAHYPFIAFVAPHIHQDQRDILAGAGAIVRELAPLDWSPEVSDDEDHPIFARFKDMFSKLHMWNQTDFTRILFLDADAFPVTNVDEMFENHISPLQECKSSLLEADDYFPDGSSSCEPYVLSAVPQSTGPDPEINVGAMVFSTSETMYRRFLQNYQKYSRYIVHMADQGFMSWQYKMDGAFPATLLERQWDGFFPQPDEEGTLKIVHEKLWATFSTGWLKQEWLTAWKEMLEWYDSDEFLLAREADHRHRIDDGKDNAPVDKGSLMAAASSTKTGTKFGSIAGAVENFW